MSLDAGTVRLGTAPEAGERIGKEQLVGQLVAFRVVGYEPAAQTKYGVGPEVTVDLLVVTGTAAGQRDPAWRCWGSLARQMGEQGREATIAARVVSGAGSAPGSRWFGLDFALDEAEVTAVRQAVAALATGTPTARAVVPSLAQAAADLDDEAVPF
jgi:hypothetical protein